LGQIARLRPDRDGVIVAPFDTELLGHWWFEGVDFLEQLYRRLDHNPLIRPVTGSRHLEEHRPRRTVRLASGSWGNRGDFSMWLNSDTEWTWRRMWALENAFWDGADAALSHDSAHPILAQAARELLLAQASDWQFIISTGLVRDYGERRFALHCDAAEQLLGSLQNDVETGHRLAEELGQRDNLFPKVLDSVAVALGRRRVPA
jgi:1,4-alpha-glucan branching enzyme